jgi:hypothetical protein
LTASQRVAPPLESLSTAARVAGSIIALAYLLGLVPGPLVSVVGGLALVTLGRALLLTELAARRAVISLAVIAGALGVGALRWGTLDLPELRGVQSVLGPSVFVGPESTAIACGLALAAGLLGLGSWLLEPHPTGRTDNIWGAVEVAIGALALVTVFIDPARSVLQGAGFGQILIEIGRWLGAVVLAVALVIGSSIAQRRLPKRASWAVLGSAAAAVAVAAGLVSVTL